MSANNIRLYLTGKKPRPYDPSNNSITINAAGNNIQANTANSCFITPIRQQTQGNALYYNNTSGEITYDVSGGSGDGGAGGFWNLTGNTFYGPSGNSILDPTLCDFSTICGIQAMRNASSSTSNVAIGWRTLYNSKDGAELNVAIGSKALTTSTSGSRNTAVGVEAMTDLTGGARNTAFGHWSLQKNCSYCTAMGNYALQINTGYYNTAVGYEAMKGNESGTYNTALGYKALIGAEKGSCNVAVGYEAMFKDHTDSSGNIAIGSYALYDASSSKISYNIAIGYKAHYLPIAGPISNTIVINATGNPESAAIVDSGTCYIKPIRQATADYILHYDASGGEITYDVSGDVPPDNKSYWKLDVSSNFYGPSGNSLASSPEILHLPTGLTPGDTFQLAFVTNATMDASSSDINVYNTFVQNQWNGSSLKSQIETYLGHPDISFNCIGSTATVDASANAVVGSGGNFKGVYKLNQEKIADDYADMWDGSIDSSFNINENGNFSSSSVWTGTEDDGRGGGIGLALGGSFGGAWVGDTRFVDDRWVKASTPSTLLLYPFYALSEILTWVQGSVDGSYNVVMGYQAMSDCSGLSSRNTAVGYRALQHGKDSAGDCVAIGCEALRYCDGSYNVGVGYMAMDMSGSTATPSVVRSVAIGYKAHHGSGLASAETTEDIVAIGYEAAMCGSGLKRTVAIGYRTMGYQQSGLGDMRCVAIGSEALYSIDPSGQKNTAIGHQSLKSLTKGVGNTTLGYEALMNAEGESSYNIAIGYKASRNVTDVSNTIVINATGEALDPSGSGRFYVKPIRPSTQTDALFYNPSSGEITYDVSGGENEWWDFNQTTKQFMGPSGNVGWSSNSLALGGSAEDPTFVFDLSYNGAVAGTYDLNYTSTKDMRGFQFFFSGDITNGSGGDAGAVGFQFGDGGNVLLGFTLSATAVAAGFGTLVVVGNGLGPGLNILYAITATNNEPHSCNSWNTVGDLNNDGRLDVKDITLIIDMILGTAGAPSGTECERLADLNDDGFITILDVIDAMNYILGNNTPPPTPVGIPILGGDVFCGYGAGADISRNIGWPTVAIGYECLNKGIINSGDVAVGNKAGKWYGGGGEALTSGKNVAIGSEAMGGSGQFTGNFQGNVAIGYEALYERGVSGEALTTGSRSYNIAIGYKASKAPPVDISHTIVINATGEALNPQDSSRCYIKPIRNDVSYNSIQSLHYDPTLGEVTYDLDYIPSATAAEGRADALVTQLDPSQNPFLDNSGSKGMMWINQVQDASGWDYVASMPRSSYAFGCVALGGKIYVMGGQPDNIEAITKQVIVYNPIDNTWSDLPPMDISRSWCGSAALGGKIYIAGGAWGSGAIYTNKVSVYNPIDNSWNYVAPLDISRSQLSCAALGGKLYAAGGCAVSGTTPVATVLVYDAIDNSWNYVASMNTARRYLGLTAAGGKLYAIGGLGSGSTYLDTVEVYDPIDNSWDTLDASLNTARGYLGACALGGKLYAVGGKRASGASNRLASVEVYDPQDPSGGWDYVAPMDISRQAVGVVAMSGRIYALGANPGVTTGEVYDPSLNPQLQVTYQGEDFYVSAQRGGPKTFIIQHPEDPERLLRHACIEAPTRGTNLYEYQIQTTEDNATTEIALPSYFSKLNSRTRVYVSGVDVLSMCSGQPSEQSPKAIIQTEKAGTFNVMVTGVRKDPAAVAYSSTEGIDDPILLEDIPQTEPKL